MNANAKTVKKYMQLKKQETDRQKLINKLLYIKAEKESKSHDDRAETVH